MELDALILSRLQFGFTIAFHIIFPSFTIGLASYLAVLEGLWLVTKDEAFKSLYLFWVRIFAISFGMGVVSGVVLSYQLGTNWSVFASVASPVIGPLLAFEVLAAFFLEASFLGVMLFGWRKVGPGLHMTATALVAVGTLISAFWIISANSWMQHPTGYTTLPDGALRTVDWMAVIFSPTFPERFGSIQDARAFCQRFFRWYNHEHRHSGIGLHTPADLHFGRAGAIRAARREILASAYDAHPERFVRKHPEPPALPSTVWINKPDPTNSLNP